MYSRENRHAIWLELFFDLIFVVALGKVTHLLAYTHNNELDSHTFLTPTYENPRAFSIRFLSAELVQAYKAILMTLYPTDLNLNF